MLREVYHLPLRSTEGLAASLLRLLGVKVPAPDYTALSRRARHLQLDLSAHAGKKIAHLVIDPAGLKLYGEGEWRVRMRGWTRHRTWRKLHLCVDASTQQVAAALLTNKEVVDPRGLPGLLKQVEAPVGRAYADAPTTRVAATRPSTPRARVPPSRRARARPSGVTNT
jgi:hypothetical protein